MITVVDRYLVANLPDPGQQGDVADLDGGDVLGVGVLLEEVLTYRMNCFGRESFLQTLSGRIQADWLEGRASSWWLLLITTE